jgi:hypothetical protein
MIPIDETQEAADGNDQEPAKPEQSLRRINEQVHAASMAREPYADLKQPPSPSGLSRPSYCDDWIF